MADDEFAAKRTKKKEADIEELSPFEIGVDRLIDSAERWRVAHMDQYRFRNFVSITTTLSLITVGGMAAGWFGLMENDIFRAIACLVLSASISVLVHGWSRTPLRKYTSEYKTRFMPEMAELLGGLQYYPSRGISASILPKTGLLPGFGHYKGEDCFMGKHADAKIILCEARLSQPKRKNDLVFDGIFALIKMDRELFEGHTIITTDQHITAQFRDTKWKRLEPLTIENEKYAHLFHAFADDRKNQKFVRDDLLKEMLEMSEIFDNAPVSLCLFRKSYVFVMIPCEEDMFEPSNLYVPITTTRNAMRLKREIEGLMSIADILHLYQNDKKEENA